MTHNTNKNNDAYNNLSTTDSCRGNRSAYLSFVEEWFLFVTKDWSYYFMLFSQQEVIFEELVPNPNAPPCQEGVVISRTTTNCSFRSEPITIPNYSDPRLSPRLPRKQDTRRVVYSVRNGSLSPWVDRYKLKQKSISTSSNMEVKNKACATGKPSVRGFSRWYSMQGHGLK